jgi:transcriptional regulator with XRE-family HTH domain
LNIPSEIYKKYSKLNKNMKNIGQKIKSIRLFLELNQIQFANSISITQGALSKIEAGDSKYISINVLDAISECYNIDLNWLVRDVGIDFFEQNKDKSKKEALANCEGFRV